MVPEEDAVRVVEWEPEVEPWHVLPDRPMEDLQAPTKTMESVTAGSEWEHSCASSRCIMKITIPDKYCSLVFEYYSLDSWMG